MVHMGAMAWIRASVAPELRSSAQTLHAAAGGGALLFAATMVAGRLYAAHPAAMYLAMAGFAAVSLALALELRRRAGSAP